VVAEARLETRMRHALIEDPLLAATALDAEVARGTGHHLAGSVLEDLHLPENDILVPYAKTSERGAKVADPVLDVVLLLDAGRSLPNAPDRALLPREVLLVHRRWSRSLPLPSQ